MDIVKLFKMEKEKYIASGTASDACADEIRW